MIIYLHILNKQSNIFFKIRILNYVLLISDQEAIVNIGFYKYVCLCATPWRLYVHLFMNNFQVTILRQSSPNSTTKLFNVRNRN